MGNTQGKPKHKYGLKKARSLNRAPIRKFAVADQSITAIQKVDLRKTCPPVYDQGDLGNCTAQSLAFAFEFDQLKQGIKYPPVPSRLFIYYNTRELEGNMDEDCGAELFNCISSLVDKGSCPEKMWPCTKDYKLKPTQDCYDIAANFKIKKYNQLEQTLHDMKKCLISGFPFICGISIFKSFESKKVAKTGIVPIPRKTEILLGGHTVVCVGFVEKYQVFIMRNSWGAKWGDDGYFYIPYKYLTDPELASDFWVVETTD